MSKARNYLNIIFHLCFAILIAYNLFYFLLGEVGFTLNVLSTLVLYFFSILFLFIVHGKLKFNLNENIWLIIFVCYLVLSAIFLNNNESFDKLAVFISRAIIPFAVLKLYVNQGYKINIKFITIIGLIISSIVIYNAFTSFGLFTRSSINFFQSKTTVELYGVIEDSRSILVTMIFTLLFFSNRLKYLFLLLLFIGLFQTQTRQTFLALSLFVVPFYIYNSGLRNLIIYITVAAIFFVFIDFEYFIQTIYNTRVFDFSDSYYYTDSREFLFFWALDLFSNAPLFGNGLGYTDGLITYPHNIIIEILAELGVIGLIIFLIFWIKSFKKLRDNRLRLMVIVLTFLSLFSGNISQNFLLFVLIGLNIKSYKYVE